jgi:hypothetical protein
LRTVAVRIPAPTVTATAAATVSNVTHAAAAQPVALCATASSTQIPTAFRPPASHLGARVSDAFTPATAFTAATSATPTVPPTADACIPSRVMDAIFQLGAREDRGACCPRPFDASHLVPGAHSVASLVSKLGEWGEPIGLVTHNFDRRYDLTSRTDG